MEHTGICCPAIAHEFRILDPPVSRFLVGLVESDDGESILRHVLPAIEELIVPTEYAEGIDDFRCLGGFAESVR